ncbi:hypothetical protein [uncultured Ruthenibacterium sp.]|uniref:hypothetical protein n=1 Tax=uncultured Ruthenibacterium sp. TaxID=1905347 RepID=UPI00349E7A2D
MTEQTDKREVQFLPPVKRYVNAIEWHLRLPLKDKVRVMSDVTTSIVARHEAGESYEEIMKEMGTPRQVAQRFNAAMGVSEKPSRWRFLFLALLVLLIVGCISKISYEQGTLAGASIMQGIVPNLITGPSGSTNMGVIGGADGPTAIFVSSTFPTLLGAILYAPLSLGCALIACYLLARGPLRWKAALRVSVISTVLFWIHVVAELIFLVFYGATIGDLLVSLGTSLLMPAFWLSAIALTISLARKKRAKKEF